MLLYGSLQNRKKNVIIITLFLFILKASLTSLDI